MYAIVTVELDAPHGKTDTLARFAEEMKKQRWTPAGTATSWYALFQSDNGPAVISTARAHLTAAKTASGAVACRFLITTNPEKPTTGTF